MINLEANSIQKKYFQKARCAAFLIWFTPFIKMVGLSGSVARGKANFSSDIDFFILARPGRIWTSRAFSVLIMAIFGLKRYQNKVAGRICLNIYQTTDHLKLTTSDITQAESYAYLVSLAGKKNLLESFKKSNQWILKYKSDFFNYDYEPNYIEKVFLFIASIFRLLGEFVFDLLFNDWGERVLMKIQAKRILKDKRTINSPKGSIFLSDKELRFHPPK